MREVRQIVVRTASSCFGGHTSVGAVGSVRGARTPACRAHTHVGACAAFGVFTATAYSERRRTNEFGIRMTLGAQPRRTLAGVIWKTAKVTGVGCAAGLGAALALNRLLGSVLFEVQPGDPAALGIAIAVLGTIAIAAC